MSKIHQLPENLVNQIKAGEVIERPASVLKEMLDNAIDSGAGSIKASIESGGLGLVLVEDDGEGIDPEDMPLAFARHATSKISNFDDLMKATTMGFRGEALASIASVAKASLLSRREQDANATSIEAENGSIGKPVPAARQRGTTASCRDLFFYVPARRKFLKSESTESAHCRDAFARSALSRPDIAMSFTKDGKQVYRLPAQTLMERARALLGNSIGEDVAAIDFEMGPYRIEGFASPIGALPSGKEVQLLYVNNRYARDRLLTHAAKEALIQSRGLGREREVCFVLKLTLPPEMVDSNAHPAKTEVRFKDPRAAHQFVYKALHDALSLLPKPAPDKDPSWSGQPLGSAPRSGQEAEIDLFGIGSSFKNTEHLGAAKWASEEISNEAERFLGPLRSGFCAWDAGSSGLWLVPSDSLAKAPWACSLAEKAEAGEMDGVQLLIESEFQIDAECGMILASRRRQLQSIGLEFEIVGSKGTVSFAPKGFDNCDWSASMEALASCMLSGDLSSVSLCMALLSGMDSPSKTMESLFEAAKFWMGRRRLSRELPGAELLAIPKM